MAEENTVEVLRRAATLMMERAEAATAGPWWHDESDLVWRLHGVAFTVQAQTFPDGSVAIPEQVMSKQIAKAPKQGTPYAEYWPDAADATWITTMHPAVGAALARWLNEAADQARGALLDGALAVARAYLGEAEGK